MIDIQDSTPDLSLELVTNDIQRVTKPPPRHSDIYITDVYNASEHGDRSISSLEGKVSRNFLFKPVPESDGVFLDPSSILPQSVNINDSTESLSSLVPSRGKLKIDVAIEYSVHQSSEVGGTLNELVSLHCTQTEQNPNKQLETSGGAGNSSSISEPWSSQSFQPVLAKHPRYSHASSTSSGSSIASSASALARTNKTKTSQQQYSLLPPLTHERISELRDKWINSREIWRLLDYIDRYLASSKLVSSLMLSPPRSQSLEQINEVVTPTPSESRRALKVKFSDQQQLPPVTPKKRQRKANAVATTNGHDSAHGVTPSTTSNNNYKTGDRVFAKWTDRKFYAATLLDRHIDGRWSVDYYDGDRRTISEDNLLRADEIAMKGQRVYAAYCDDDFTLGIVTDCELAADGQLRYTVMRDDRDICVPAEQILLSESQAKQIRLLCNHCHNGNGALDITGNATYDHITATPSGRALRSRTRALTRDSPVPSSSGIKKKQASNAGNNKSTASTVTASDSEDDVTADINATTCNGIDVFVPGLEPEVAAAYDGCSKLKGKTVIGKMRFGSGRTEDLAALGPLPPIGSQLFKGLHILLSCVRPVTGGEPLVSSSTSEADSCSSYNENYRFSTSPCVKTRLTEQLEAGGAKVYARFEDLPSCVYKQAYIISNRPSHSANYMLCLAAGIRPVCHEWVIRCCVEGRVLPRQDLPCGWSLEREDFVGEFNRATTCGRPLRRKLVLVASSTDSSFARFWTRILELAEANVRSLITASDSDFNRVLCILCECDYRDEHTERAVQRNVPLVTPIWLIQTLVHSELRDFNKLSCYRPDYLDMD